MPDTMMTYALRYAAQGFKVLALKPKNKVPLTEHGLKDATQLQVTIKELWTRWPDANIGIVTDGYAVLDFDAEHGGLESKEKLIAKQGPFLPTRVHKTGGGGEHWIYRQHNGQAIRNTVKVAGYTGVDLRGTGGYIVAPPSIHPNGNEYLILDPSPIAPCPEWIPQLIQTVGRLSQRPMAPGASIPESTRNDTMIRNAGAMRRRGMTEEEILAALLVQNKRCEPPLPEKEVQTIAQSVVRYEPDPIESLPQEPDPLTDIPTDNTDIADKLSELTKTDLSVEGRRDRIVWPLVAEWLMYHRGETFDLDTICRQLEVKTRDDRHSVVKKLAYEVSRKTLDKINRQYTYIDKTFTLIDWQHASEHDEVALKWPYGRGDEGTPNYFPLDEITICEGDIIVLAGVSNMGKTAFILNLLWENMDAFPCTLQGSEYKPADFKRRIKPMTWANPLKEDGTPKFELIERHDRWQDIIRPDNINLIDWINLGDQFYQIGKIIEAIKAPLRKGVAVIAIQKDEDKKLGMGGGWGEHLSTVYLLFDKERLTIRKAKRSTGTNLNGKVFGFRIVDEGTKFTDIRELERCRHCWGSGKFRGGECDDCQGKGWIDAYHNY